MILLRERNILLHIHNNPREYSLIDVRFHYPFTRHILSKCKMNRQHLMNSNMNVCLVYFCSGIDYDKPERYRYDRRN